MKSLTPAPEAVEAFKVLFPSYTRAHGLFQIEGTDAKTGKKKGKARTLNTQAPIKAWEEHIAGGPPPKRADAMGNTKKSQAGAFPRRIQLGPDRVSWVKEEVEAWPRERMEDRGTA